jgi:hypothetical protein
VKYAGHKIGEKRKDLDKYIPNVNYKKDRATYESGILKCTKRKVRDGKTVVIVGGGYGVTATEAAKKVGAEGRVYVYEGSAEFIEKCKRTLKVNGVLGSVSLHPAIVGDFENLRGFKGNPEYIDPSLIPECNILELDCEGAELNILKRMEISPDTIIVETHGHKGGDLEKVKRELKRNGYSIEHVEYADESKKQFCKKNDILVLQAERTNSCS